MARRTYHRFCPLSMALEDVGDRWTLHIVYALLGGPKRYADLRVFLAGAGSNVLSDRLRQLADAQIVTRRTGERPGSVLAEPSPVVRSRVEGARSPENELSPAG